MKICARPLSPSGRKSHRRRCGLRPPEPPASAPKHRRERDAQGSLLRAKATASLHLLRSCNTELEQKSTYTSEKPPWGEMRWQ